jgi:F0F1-type ATP synthase assembly protein I
MPQNNLSKKAPEKQKSIWVIAGEYSSVAMILPASVFAGYLIGYLLDKQFGTTYLYLVFLLLGIVSGFIQIFRFLKKHQDG